MLPHFHRKVLQQRQRKLIERFEEVEYLVETGAISQQEADYLLQREFGATVHDQLEHVKGHLSNDFAVRASLSLVGIVLVFGLLFGSVTGFSVAGFPIAQDMNIVISESYNLALNIPKDITSLSVSGQYTGSDNYSVLLVSPSTAYVVASSSQRVLRSTCLESCTVDSSGPYTLYVEVTDGVFDLSQIQYTKK